MRDQGSPPRVGETVKIRDQGSKGGGNNKVIYDLGVTLKKLRDKGFLPQLGDTVKLRENGSPPQVECRATIDLKNVYVYKGSHWE